MRGFARWSSLPPQRPQRIASQETGERSTSLFHSSVSRNGRRPRQRLCSNIGTRTQWTRLSSIKSLIWLAEMLADSRPFWWTLQREASRRHVPPRSGAPRMSCNTTNPSICRVVSVPKRFAEPDGWPTRLPSLLLSSAFLLPELPYFSPLQHSATLPGNSAPIPFILMRTCMHIVLALRMCTANSDPSNSVSVRGSGGFEVNGLTNELKLLPFVLGEVPCCRKSRCQQRTNGCSS
mmetsp:Transcript_24478/g.53234  ORF Transcript_24478/g.53234 Transcript_24478/m.53234 type:complete len:235 (-) Transcript_24478:7-711(-)